MNNLFRTWQYFKQYRLSIAVAMIASVAVSGTDAAMAYLSKDVLDKIFIEKDVNTLRILPMVLITLFIVRLVSRFVQSYFIKSAAQKSIEKIRNDMYHKLIRMPLSYFHENPTGVISNKVLTDINNLQNSVSSALSIFRSTVSVIFLSAVLFNQDFRLALSIFVIAPIVVIIIRKSGSRMKATTKKTQEQLGEVSNLLIESFKGIRVIKSFASEKRETERFTKASIRLFRYLTREALIASVSSPLIETIAGFAVAFMIFYGGYNVINGEITPGTFFSFLTAFGIMFEPIKKINSYNHVLQKANTSADRIYSVLDTENDITKANGSLKCEAAGKNISFEDVKFRYSSENPQVLSGLNLNIDAGATVALVGHSGSGKSTVASLIPRFYDVTEGSIKIGGTDIRDFDIYSLRKNISIVNQEPFLFNNTVRYNIAYGSKDTDDEAVFKAAKHAYANGFINDMPNGYDTVLGEMGVRLSGGQKQRITIARALMADAPIVIMDEATSALDTESEKIVQKAIDNLIKDKTAIIIAHRLSTIVNADKIIVLERGIPVSEGTHEELLKSCAAYSRMYQNQFGSERV